jgi:hypothetical protein
MFDLISGFLDKNGILKYFYKFIYGKTVINTKGFHPDVNGYSLIFMLPPELSGYNNTEYMTNISKMFVFLALDFTPPQIVVNTSDVSSTIGSLSTGSEVHSGGQVSITYLDDQDLNCFSFHNTWVEYIKNITTGLIEPDPKYLNSDDEENFGVIDYATSAYVVRFRPSFELNSDILYVGKAVGIIPLGSNDKEIIGRRDANELTMLNYSYQCPEYLNTTGNDKNKWLIDEFHSKIASLY